MKQISIIIPCFNEEENLKHIFKKSENLFGKNNDIEVILVDNGSTDNTYEMLRDILNGQQHFIKVVRVKSNIGYGHGIMSGVNSASGEVIAWTHADLQTDPGDLLEGLKMLREISNPEKALRIYNIFCRIQFFFTMIIELKLSFMDCRGNA